MSKSAYKKEVVDPGDRASKLAHQVNIESYGNCPALTVVPLQPGNFRGAVGRIWNPDILRMMAETQYDGEGNVSNWRMVETDQNDGAGGKGQFLTLSNKLSAWRNFGWEIITMTADDLARTGCFPAVMINEINVKNINKKNFPIVRAIFQGYGKALNQAGLVNITGETAVMKHSITAFCDIDSPEQLCVAWGATCLGLAYKDALIDGSGIRPGLSIVGLLEHGYRCNGGTFFTNLILEKWGPDILQIMMNDEAMRFVEKLTKPSISYAKLISALVGWRPDGSIGDPAAEIFGIAHITGGGVWGKLGDLLPEGVGADLGTMPDPLPVFLEAQKLSLRTSRKLTDVDIYGDLHGGVGMLIICDDEDVSRIISGAKSMGKVARKVGKTTASPTSEIQIRSRFMEDRWLSSEEREKK